MHFCPFASDMGSQMISGEQGLQHEQEQTEEPVKTVKRQYKLRQDTTSEQLCIVSPPIVLSH